MVVGRYFVSVDHAFVYEFCHRPAVFIYSLYPLASVYVFSVVFTDDESVFVSNSSDTVCVCVLFS